MYTDNMKNLHINISTCWLFLIIVYFLNNTTIQILYTDFYPILSHVYTAYFKHQVGVVVHKKSRKGRDLSLQTVGIKLL